MAEYNKANDHRFGEINLDVKEIKNDVKVLKDNHLSHLEVNLVQVTTDVAWLKKSYWVVVVASIGGLIGAVINLIIK